MCRPCDCRRHERPRLVVISIIAPAILSPSTRSPSAPGHRIDGARGTVLDPMPLRDEGRRVVGHERGARLVKRNNADA